MSAAPIKEVFYDTTVQRGTVKGVYAHLDSLVYSLDKLKKAGLGGDIIVTTPLPRHDVEHVLYGGKPSPVRWFTLFGALFGGTFGFTLCSMTHLNWAMIIPAGKPLVSIPAFMVITFESTVLWGCLFTLLGMLVLTKLPAKKLQIEVQDPRFSDDKFGLVVNNLSRKKAEKVYSILNENGVMSVVNGYTQAKNDVPEKHEKPAPSPEQGFEEDVSDTSMLAKLAIATSIIIILTLIGVKWYFSSTLAEELEQKDYTYSERAVAPSHRTNK
jgi:hypothetical protein